MKAAKVTIQGTRPMLWHCFSADTIPLTKKERTGVAGNDPEEWRRTFSATPDGQLYIQPSYIFGCLRNGAKYTKNGRSTLQASVAATLQVMDDTIAIDRWFTPDPEPNPALPVYIDVRPVVNPATKGKNVRYRLACSAGWNTTFHIAWAETIVSTQQMEAIVIDSGRLVGLGDGRSIGFGRFEVMSFEVEEYATKKTS